MWKVKVTQLCPTLCDPTDCSPPGSSVHGILQARILEWVAISFSRGSSWPRGWTRISRIAGRLLYVGSIFKNHRDQICGYQTRCKGWGRRHWRKVVKRYMFVCAQSLICNRLFVTPWTVVHQAPIVWGFPWQEHWSGFLFPPPGDLPNPGIEPESSALTGSFFTTELPGKPLKRYKFLIISKY